MATSDSEDFESADEWEEDGDSEEKLKHKGSNEDINETVIADDKSRSSRNSEADIQVQSLPKTFEKKASLAGDDLPLPARCDVTVVTKEPPQEIKTSENKDVCMDPAPQALTESDGWDIEDLEDDLLGNIPLEGNLKEDIQNVEVKSMESVKNMSRGKSNDGVSCVEEKPKEKVEEKFQQNEKPIERKSKEDSDQVIQNICTANSRSEENFDSVLNKLSASVEKEQQSSTGGGWGGWGGWGVTSLLSTASESVTTLTTQVSSGLTSVLESGLGVPNPEELVKQEIEEEKKLQETYSEKEIHNESETGEASEGGIFGFGRVMSGVSSITKLVETASNKVVTGGLDTLETIGKKTMEVLQEGDPGLRKKRALFQEKINLSQVLREAKEKAETEDIEMKDKEEARKAHFESLFDDFHGLVHLEALEMLSKQCAVKLESVLLNVSSAKVADLQHDVSNIKELCQLPEDDETEELDSGSIRVRLMLLGKGLSVPVGSEKLVKTWDETQQWLEETNTEPKAAREIHQKAIASLARMTAESVELFHKTAELLLVQENRDPQAEATVLLEITSTLTSQVSTSATSFSECLNSCSESDSHPELVKSHITNVFLEAANSSSYIQEAFQLLVPVLQIGVASL